LLALWMKEVTPSQEMWATFLEARKDKEMDCP
jgi:uncharacterized protein YeaO (DUF488 family)